MLHLKEHVDLGLRKKKNTFISFKVAKIRPVRIVAAAAVQVKHQHPIVTFGECNVNQFIIKK